MYFKAFSQYTLIDFCLLQSLAVPSACCTYPHIHVWYLQQPRFERKRAEKQTHRITDQLTERPTDYNNPSLRMRARGLVTITYDIIHACIIIVCTGAHEGQRSEGAAKTIISNPYNREYYRTLL